jgi:hypothetical protein
MKRHVLLSLAVAGLMSAVGVAQATPPQTTPPQTPPAQAAPVMQEMTIVGCVVKSTRPNAYLIERAVDPAKKDDQPRTYRIQAQMEDPDFETHVNAKVEFKGSAEARADAAAGRKNRRERSAGVQREELPARRGHLHPALTQVAKKAEGRRQRAESKNILPFAF